MCLKLHLQLKILEVALAIITEPFIPYFSVKHACPPKVVITVYLAMAVVVVASSMCGTTVGIYNVYTSDKSIS